MTRWRNCWPKGRSARTSIASFPSNGSRRGCAPWPIGRFGAESFSRSGRARGGGERGGSMTSIVIDRRYCGPPNSGNGGYVCGRLARHIGGGAEVTLRAPPPLDRQLDVVATDEGFFELRDGAAVLATGRPASVELARLERASFDEAHAAEL